MPFITLTAAPTLGVTTFAKSCRQRHGRPFLAAQPIGSGNGTIVSRQQATPSPGEPSADANSDKQAEAQEQQPVKRKRGRPKGTKNPKPIPRTLPPFEEYSKRWKVENDASSSSSSNGDTKAKPKPKPKPKPKAKPKANSTSGAKAYYVPNGVRNAENDDLFQELLPILAEEELQEFVEETEHEKMVRAYLKELIDEIASRHRFSSESFKNLMPFKLAELEMETCSRCNGEGMNVCSYCNGEGFVDFGENMEKYHTDFPDGSMKLSERVDVIGNVYNCPMCGGLCKERCLRCVGFGRYHKSVLEGVEHVDPTGKSKDELDFIIGRRVAEYMYESGLDDDDDEDDGEDPIMFGESNDDDEHDDEDGDESEGENEKGQRKRTKKGAATKKTGLPENNDVWVNRDIDDLLDEYDREGRLEYGKDGTIIVRAKPRGKVGRPKRDKTTDTAAAKQGQETVKKKGRKGRPTKQAADPVTDQWSEEAVEGLFGGDDSETDDDSDGNRNDLAAGEVKAIRKKKNTPIGPSTDFVNTTDYKVSRKLRKLPKAGEADRPKR